MTPEQRAYWDVDDVVRRLRRIEGQVRGVQSMIQSEQSCQKILIQVAAIEGALKQVARIVSACSIAEQVMQAQQAADPTEAVKSALKQLINYA
ncbi:metal-sensitive transcriptional regulator [Sulfobacillus harzensis]|uniref:Metal-sensitive transcriptional regulator n=1 Tax=Sulfobacillus harzensis TaxID=2729629 RepID=A0A7Y0Q1X8_9FIRM|nr:metal-sensitive transcriptional regulator [Sulfobacillus harzensis]NMP21917.1 metal-sensitive transcriptional regulator [Sulfobacillus harzensis]